MTVTLPTSSHPMTSARAVWLVLVMLARQWSAVLLYSLQCMEEERSSTYLHRSTMYASVCLCVSVCVSVCVCVLCHCNKLKRHSCHFVDSRRSFQSFLLPFWNPGKYCCWSEKGYRFVSIHSAVKVELKTSPHFTNARNGPTTWGIIRCAHRPRSGIE